MALPPLFRNAALTLAFAFYCLWESSASGQEKRSRCHGNGAASDEHFRDEIVFDCGADVNATGTKNLDSLLDDDLLSASNKAVANEVCDRAS